MQLITNKINAGKAGRFEDFIENFKKSQIKTASTKVAEEKDEGKSSGQLDVEPLHQEGESTTMPKAGPSAKKDDGKKSSKAVSDPEKDGKDSGQPKAEGSEKFTNDPKAPSKKEKGSSAKTKVKVAEDASMCDGCGKCSDECECNDCKCASCSSKAKTAGRLPDALKEYQFKAKGEKDDEKEDKKDDGEKDEKKDDKKASTSAQFVKWANLDSKNKSFLTKYWKQLFGDDYVNALVSDK